MKLIYLSFSKLTKRIVDDYYVEKFINAGVNVSYWDLTEFLHLPHTDFGEINAEYLLKIKTYHEFVLMLKKNSDCIFVTNIPYNISFIYFYLLLSKYKINFSYIEYGPKPSLKSSKVNRLRKYFSSPFFFIRLFFENLIIVKIPLFLRLIKYYENYFTPTGFNSGLLKSKSIIKINYIDYDRYLDSKFFEKPLVDFNYAVYLDTNLTAHSDLLLWGLQLIDKKRYYENLNSYFDSIEKRHNLKIVIAAHPSAIYTSNPFNGRKIFYRKAQNLTKFCSFGIVDSSSSISYLVMNSKPFYLIYSLQFISNYEHHVMPTINTYKEFFCIEPHCIDDKLSYLDAKLTTPNPEIYKKYMYEYLTSYDTQNVDSFSIIYNRLISH